MGIAPTDEELFNYYAGYPVHDNVSAVTVKRYSELLDGFEHYRRTNRIIDVGCGAGIFLEEAAKRGWEVHGTEYGERALVACRSRNIRIIEGALDPANYEPEGFDVVCSFEVIEHLPRPKEELERMVRILRPGGALYMTTPNYRSLGHELAGSAWSIVNYPEHLNYFTPRTLRQLGATQHLRPTTMLTTGVSLVRLRGRHTDDSERRKAVMASQDDFREQLEVKPLLKLAKRMINAVLDLFGIGDSMKGTFVKPGA
ncbi:MAG: class I SAM-dependent methyltransferase [Flavobacteriales bacterium]